MTIRNCVLLDYNSEQHFFSDSSTHTHVTHLRHIIISHRQLVVVLSDVCLMEKRQCSNP